MVVSLSSSNLSVEESFSLCTLMLSNRCLCINHDTLHELMSININEKLWNPQEREGLIDYTVQNFFFKRLSNLHQKKNRNLTRFTSDSDTNSSFEDTENNPNTDRENEAGTD